MHGDQHSIKQKWIAKIILKRWGFSLILKSKMTRSFYLWIKDFKY